MGLFPIHASEVKCPTCASEPGALCVPAINETKIVEYHKARRLKASRIRIKFTDCYGRVWSHHKTRKGIWVCILRHGNKDHVYRLTWKDLNKYHGPLTSIPLTPSEEQ